MGNNITELKPKMTRAKALKSVLDYVSEHGYPVMDVILHCEVENDNGAAKLINEWTFQGLCKFLINEQ